MHIAVCMDDALGRKQLERLLSRSADRRIAADPDVPYYVQSYGNKEALFARPFMYDLFFIDMLHDDMDSIAIIRKLRMMGVTATVVLCPGKVDLTEQLTEEDQALILRQPVKVEELEHILDEALAVIVSREPRIDIRTSTETIHIKEEEFLYAEKLKDGVAVHMNDGREVICPEDLKNFWYRVANFDDIYYLQDSLIVHKQAVKDTSFGRVVLTDERKFRISHHVIKTLESKL